MQVRLASVVRIVPALFLLCGFPLNAEPGVEAVTVAPAGEWFACAISPQGVHAAVLAPKGQQQTVWLDGVEGPAFDELLPFDGRPFAAGQRMNTTTRIPVVFSEDGEHHAYFAKAGVDYVLYRDGRELARGKHGLKLTGLAFSTGAHHVYFIESDPALGTCLVMDGKPGPRLQDAPKVVFSADGKRFAYTARPKGQPKATLFVDGEEAGYAGEDPQFTRDGKTLVSLVRAPTSHVVQLDGKPLFRARHVYKVYVSPFGDQIISVVGNDRGLGTHLRLFDKEIPDSECGAVRNVFFSPDGKRYAALCSNHGYTKNLKQVNEGEYIFLDGRRGTIYQRIRDAVDMSQDQPRQLWIAGGWAPRDAGVVVPGFTPDSQRFVYMPHINQEEFVVANEEVSEAYPLGRLLSPVIGGGGRRLAYIFLDPLRKIVVDGQTRDLRYVPHSLSFSPDGAHVAYGHATICLDGADLPLNGDRPAKYLFSPDSKTFAVFGRASVPPARGLFLDGDLVLANAENAERPVFTPDSRHLLWLGKRGSFATQQEPYAAYVDGRPVLAFFELINARDNWQMSASGVLTCVARVGDTLKRIRITPSATDGIAAMKATAKATGAPVPGDLAAPALVAAVSAPAASPPTLTAPAPTDTPPTPSPTSPPGAAPQPAPTPQPAVVPPAAPAAVPDPIAEATKKAKGAIDGATNKAKSWLDSLTKKKK